MSNDDVYRFPGLQRYERDAQRSMRDGDWYDTAQICLNGHTITYVLIQSPELGQQFCHECGAPTISACPSCGASIHGYFHRSWIVHWGFTYSAPNHCYACGAMYPWTVKNLDAARELADELALTDDEKEVVKERLPDISQDTPTAQASAYKVKRLLDKAREAGSVAAGLLYKIAIDYASETTKKILTGP